MKTITKAGKLLQVHAKTTDYEIRTEEIQGRPFWIVPVVMMVEGVHRGSRGPILYTEEELAASIGAWGGMPVTIGHPQDKDGHYISANTPGVFAEVVGRIYNPQMEGVKLKAECWIDVNALQSLSEDAYNYIKEKKALDVSVGVFSQETRTKGEWGGEEYRAEAVNIIPDHLALLPGERGACSWDDGCGIRNNSKDMKTDTFDPNAWLQTLLEHHSELIANETSYGDIIRSLHDQVGRGNNEKRYSYVEEVYADYFVYCTVTSSTGDRAYYKREYEVGKDGNVNLIGLPTEVRKEISFVAMKLSRTKFSNFKQTKMSKKPCSCTVDSLIQNKATKFTEDDREWLSAMSQEQLNKLDPEGKEAEEEEEETPAPVANKKAAPKKAAAATDGEPLVTNKDGKIHINGKSIDEYVKESLAGETDPVKFIDNFMPEGVKGQMKSGLKMYQDRRAKQIKEIAANSKFKAEQLSSWNDEDLNALHTTLVENQGEDERGNYAPLTSGASEGQSEDDNGSIEEITAMLSFAKKPEQAKK